MHATEILSEADRLMTVCNSCRYCEGLCAVFPAMELRREFNDSDLNYLANLCHNCGACFVDCQFAPPHEFSVNVPATLAIVRNESYIAYAWPRALAPLFDRHGLSITLISALAVAIILLALIGLHAPDALFAVHSGPGAFYRLMPHNTMAVLFGGVFTYSLFAIVMSARQFWQAQQPRLALSFSHIKQAVTDAASLRYLSGGGPGCAEEASGPDKRKLYHHLTAYGFALCFAATSVATLYHYLLAREAPYPWYDLPVVFGSLGGIGLIIGPLGLLREKWRRAPELSDSKRWGMDTAFILLLALVSLSGFALLIFRETSAMGLILSLHLGLVLGFFLTLPYSKMVHGLYRFLALIRYSQERDAHSQAK